LSGEEQKNTRQEKGDWESELWSLIDNSDGINCPLEKSCRYQNNSNICLNKNKHYTDALHKFLDSDFLIAPPPFKNFPQFPQCMVNSKIFSLIEKLAKKHAKPINSNLIPVPMNIATDICPGQIVEVRLVPLKTARGAVWHLRDAWVIHINEKDSPARRRFTLYHEIFHVLAHCNATPVFKKNPDQRNGDFNELLADFFSGMMILPGEIMRKKWLEIKNIREMATIFDVPEPVMYCGLKWAKLI